MRGEAPTSLQEDPQINVEVEARGVTVATTSRTPPREWWKKGTLPSPVLNPNPLYLIVSLVSVAEVEVDNVTTRALLDTGTTTNVMTLAYAKKLGLEPKPIMNLMKRKVTFSGVGNSCAVLKGYVEFNLQVPGVSCFNQDHVALLVKDESKFAKKIPFILGTRTLDCVVENLLESEEDKLSTTWKRAKVVCSLARKFQELGCHALDDEGELELKNHANLSNKGIPDLLSHRMHSQDRISPLAPT